MNKVVASLLLLVGFIAACTPPTTEHQVAESHALPAPTNVVKPQSEIVWEKLNPARGDQSPQAGTLWGDRKGTAATGFLAKFVDGFSSPPHIHNVTYRAVVISGLVHNDDPDAANMWMKPGSFWTQPAGESHITSAKGQENIALVEINQGPYLVKPIEEAHDNGERPVNIDVSNLVWLDRDQTNWISAESRAEISFLLDEGDGLKSLFVKLPKGFKGEIKTSGTVVHAVVIAGEIAYTLPQNGETQMLEKGSYFGATDSAIHPIKNPSEGEAILYFRTNGEVEVS